MGVGVSDVAAWVAVLFVAIGGIWSQARFAGRIEQGFKAMSSQVANLAIAVEKLAGVQSTQHGQISYLQGLLDGQQKKDKPKE